MNKFENIVVGLDISSTSESILQRAFELAKQNDSKVTIVHAINTNWFAELFSSASNLEELQTHTKQSIEKIIKQIDTKGVEYSILINKETASNFVVDTARELDASLIVIGANNNTGSTILGSTAHKIAQNSRLPLLIVKNPYEKAYNNFVTFTDLSETAHTSLTFAKDFFNKDAIKTVYAYKLVSEIALQYYDEIDNKDKIRADIQRKEKAKFDEYVAKHNLTDVESIESEAGISSALLEFVDTNQNDLVILGSKGVNNSTSFLYGSTTSYLMENLKSDLLIYVPKF